MREVIPRIMDEKETTCGYENGEYVLPPLPYAAEDLSEVLDAETVLLHHDKHHAAYVAGANSAAGVLRRIAKGDLAAELAPSAMEQLAFNLGGHVLHCLYWKSLSPEQQETPVGTLASAINTSFGSMEGFERIFRAVTLGVQGSGWGVLGLDPVSGLLRIFGVQRHQDIFVPGVQPLMACDVWEHAYYLRYHSNRAGYVDNFLRHIDWNNTQQRLTALSHE